MTAGDATLEALARHGRVRAFLEGRYSSLYGVRIEARGEFGTLWRGVLHAVDGRPVFVFEHPDGRLEDRTRPG